MSKYTTEVRFICEQNAGLNESEGCDSVDKIIENARTKIFNFSYPIFDENYRSVLECKILKHFYTREIGEETVGLWKLRLNTKLNEIMPYYNKLYESELLKFNPLYTHNLERSYGKSVEATSDSSGLIKSSSESSANASGKTSSNEWDKYSDTPQGGLTGVENDTYLTNARNISSSGDNSGSQSGSQRGSSSSSDSNKSNSVEGYLEKVSGFDGKSASTLLQEYRETFLNIDVMIIEELEVLFMQLW